MYWNHIIKGTSTPVIIRASGVDFHSMADIQIKIGDEVYTKVGNPQNVVTFENDVTRLDVNIGLVTSLGEAKYLLHLKVINANFPSGSVLTDCVINDLEVVVRDEC